MQTIATPMVMLRYVVKREATKRQKLWTNEWCHYIRRYVTNLMKHGMINIQKHVQLFFLDNWTFCPQWGFFSTNSVVTHKLFILQKQSFFLIMAIFLGYFVSYDYVRNHHCSHYYFTWTNTIAKRNNCSCWWPVCYLC